MTIMRSISEIILEMYEGIGTHPVFVALFDTVSDLLIILKNINAQYNPLIKSTSEPAVVSEDAKCEPTFTREIFMASGIMILTAVVIKQIWSSSRECKILEGSQVEQEKKFKKENGSKIKELYKTLHGLKNYITASPELEVPYLINKILPNERKRGTTPRSPYSEVCKQQSPSMNQYGNNENKYARVKESLLKALILLEEHMKSKELDKGDANNRNLGYWSNKEEITEALRALGIQESEQGNRRTEVWGDGGTAWSERSNLDSPRSALEKEQRSVVDQCRQVPNREEILEALRVLGILESKPTGERAKVLPEIERPWSRYPNSSQAESVFESEMNAKPRMPNLADQCTQVDRFSAVAKPGQALLPFQELERNGRSVDVNASTEYGGPNTVKSFSKRNEAQSSLKLSLMDMRSDSIQQKVTCDCSSMDLSGKRGKESTGLLNLTANRNTINIELLLNRNIQMS